jgi:hypothetical protein
MLWRVKTADPDAVRSGGLAGSSAAARADALALLSEGGRCRSSYLRAFSMLNHLFAD